MPKLIPLSQDTNKNSGNNKQQKNKQHDEEVIVLDEPEQNQNISDSKKSRQKFQCQFCSRQFDKGNTISKAICILKWVHYKIFVVHINSFQS